MNRVLTSLIVILCFAGTAFSQDPKMQRAAQNGRPLATQITVTDQVTAQAVLIPRVDARRIFGKEIADNYAVIEINVGNKSPDAALIIHGIFIDYTRWALSGTPGQSSNMVDGLLRERSEPFQASTVPNQIASEEYRVVRGQLLDAQMWSKRNWTMRLLTFAGQLASAYSFSLSEEGIIRGLNAFSGTAVPGMNQVWPDGTIEQLNRVSDFGYQANKVIPKQGAEVIVCFFPIDRFLTPGFKKLFLRSPALFFAPLQMLVDPTLKNEAEGIIKGINSRLSVEELRKDLPCYLRVVQELRFGPGRYEDSFGAQVIANSNETCEGQFGLAATVDAKGNRKLSVTNPSAFGRYLALDFLSQMSLNTVTVKVDGVMSVDTTNIAAHINEIGFDRVANCGDNKESCFWADTGLAGGVRTGTLKGAYLTGGSLSISEAEALGITEVKTISEGSSDQTLQFSFRLTKPIPPETLLHFTVSKIQQGDSGKTIVSLPRELLVGYPVNSPRVTDLKQDGSKLTVTGTGFFDMPPTFPLIVKLRAPNGAEIEVKPSEVKSTEFKVTVPDDAAPPGCWAVLVSLGTNPAPLGNTDCFCFFVAPTPLIESATKKDEQIIVQGVELIDTRLCGGPRLAFQLLKEGSTTPIAGEIALLTPGRAVLKLPAAAKEGKWTVRVLLNGQPVPNSDPVPLQ